MELFSYGLISKNKIPTIMQGGKLIHQFVVDAWATIKQAKF
jgi:hypothetical protein